MTAPDGFQEKNGWRYPDSVDEPEDHLFYRIPFGDTEVQDLGKNAHLHLAHQAGMVGKDVEVVESEFDHESNLIYAVTKVTIDMGDETYSATAGADTTSNQVRDHEHVWSVAESRAIKRAVKFALDIHEAPAGTDLEEDRREAGRDTRDVPDNAPDGVDSMPSEWGDSSDDDEDVDTGGIDF